MWFNSKAISLQSRYLSRKRKEKKKKKDQTNEQINHSRVNFGTGALQDMWGYGNWKVWIHQRWFTLKYCTHDWECGSYTLLHMLVHEGIWWLRDSVVMQFKISFSITKCKRNQYQWVSQNEIYHKLWLNFKNLTTMARHREIKHKKTQQYTVIVLMLNSLLYWMMITEWND